LYPTPHGRIYSAEVKRLLTGIIICASALVWVLVFFIAEEHLRGSWALNHRVNVLKSRGAILSVSALEPHRPSIGQNAAIGLMSLSNRLATVMSNLDNTPPLLRLCDPGHAIVAWKLPEWSRDGKVTNDWTKVGKELDDSAELFNQIRESLEKPSYESGFDYQTGFVSFRMAPIASLRHIAQLLSIAEVYELSRGRLEPARRHLNALIRLVAVQRPEPLMIAQMVRQACAAFAFGATWQALQAEGWTDAQLASVQSAWQACDFVHDMAAAMEMERALSLDFYEQIQESSEKLNLALGDRMRAAEMTGGVFDGFATHGLVLKWIHVPLWQAAWADQGALYDLNQWQVIIERERIARTNGWAVLAERLDARGRALPWAPFLQGKEKLNWYNKVRLLFGAENAGVGDQNIRRTLSIQTQQQMALAVIAIERYRLKRGRIPAELSALVPEYLSAVPRDGMDGKALRYRLASNGRFQLYSVGQDGKDNGGDPTLRPGAGPYPQIWDGRDAVWPSAATTEEAEKSLMIGNKGH
jgi:hypothetical protein